MIRNAALRNLDVVKKYRNTRKMSHYLNGDVDLDL